MPRTGATLHVRGHVRGLPLLVRCVGMAPGTPAEKTPHEPELGRTVEAANAGVPNHVRRRAAISRYPRTDCHDLCSVTLGRLSLHVRMAFFLRGESHVHVRWDKTRENANKTESKI